jgi:hypothetical protein
MKEVIGEIKLEKKFKKCDSVLKNTISFKIHMININPEFRAPTLFQNFFKTSESVLKNTISFKIHMINIKSRV